MKKLLILVLLSCFASPAFANADFGRYSLNKSVYIPQNNTYNTENTTYNGNNSQYNANASNSTYDQNGNSTDTDAPKDAGTGVNYFDNEGNNTGYSGN